MPERFIVCGDLHWRSVNPVARVDNFQEALTAKLYEVFQLAREHIASAIIIPGDIFDSSHLSLSTIGDLAEILDKRPCAVLTVPGNHDEYAGNIDSLARTPYGLLARLELIWNVHATPWGSPLGSVVVTGHGFNNETDRDKSQYSINRKRDRRAIIHLAHGMLLEKAPPFEMRHTLLSELEELPDLPDVLINGHYHAGMEVQWVRQTMVVNPGALCRLSASAEEMARPVQVAVLTVNGPGDCRVEMAPLQCARPGCEVLTRDHIERKAETEERINRFLSLLAAEGESKFLEVRDIVSDIARREALPDAVVKDALDRIAKAREDLGKTA
ncbi:metallophosphoesterase family protein [Pelotomaculum propionicicum]|uniref:3',5'-cyclic adenosine monophosphate phosphodiesterase CpdA n=1 Tax=Pelotomaculum propionicicum TaxID=258475 RepID=A0A4Y7RXK2_9FIRM|nr:metallophosphoesterase [Pelotomaculum propionicicum]TEB13402.1 3',5'-cyclic adenosine monophosphate phosphodiesterase CpdA [Pelotomaculum propionicicum]